MGGGESARGDLRGRSRRKWQCNDRLALAVREEMNTPLFHCHAIDSMNGTAGSPVASFSAH